METSFWPGPLFAVRNIRQKLDVVVERRHVQRRSVLPPSSPESRSARPARSPSAAAVTVISVIMSELDSASDAGAAFARPADER